MEIKAQGETINAKIKMLRETGQRALDKQPINEASARNSRNAKKSSDAVRKTPRKTFSLP